MKLSDDFTPAFDHVMCDKSASLLGRLIYCRIARFTSNDKSAFPSQQWLAEEFGSNERQIRIELKKLSDMGLITKKQRGKNQTNVYTVNAWSTDAHRQMLKSRSERKNEILDRQDSTGLDRQDSTGLDRQDSTDLIDKHYETSSNREVLKSKTRITKVDSLDGSEQCSDKPERNCDMREPNKSNCEEKAAPAVFAEPEPECNYDYEDDLPI